MATVAAGCNDDGDNVLIFEEFTVDNFPGDQIADNNVADDGRALSINDQAFIGDSLKCHPNGGTGRFIITFGTIDGDDNTHLWATFFDGNNFTPPVELLGVDIDIGDNPQFQGIIVGWLNTAGFNESNVAGDNAAVQARNGDAVILWVRSDDSLVNGDDGVGRNDRLYYSYFNVDFIADLFFFDDGSIRGVVGEIFQHGFTETGLIVDALDEGDGNADNGDDQSREDVVTLGVMSDGLCGCATFTGAVQGTPGVNFASNTVGGGVANNDVEWGDAVTHIVAF
jgi:hypothetical protein